VALKDDPFTNDYRGSVYVSENFGRRLDVHALVRGDVAMHFTADGGIGYMNVRFDQGVIPDDEVALGFDLSLQIAVYSNGSLESEVPLKLRFLSQKVTPFSALFIGTVLRTGFVEVGFYNLEHFIFQSYSIDP
jgi:hypothetical protein